MIKELEQKDLSLKGKDGEIMQQAGHIRQLEAEI